MSYQQKINTVTVWANQKLKDSQPDYRGTINVEGKLYEIALWNKISSVGKGFLGGQIQEPRQKQEQPKVQEKTPFDDSDIPW